MKLNILALALTATVLGAAAAQADSVVIRAPGAGVVVRENTPKPNVVVRERVTTGVNRRDCDTKVVSRTNTNTDTTRTVKTTKCD